jgi:hypothetical protein
MASLSQADVDLFGRRLGMIVGRWRPLDIPRTLKVGTCRPACSDRPALSRAARPKNFMRSGSLSGTASSMACSSGASGVMPS